MVTVYEFTTKVSGEPIEDFAVLREGTSEWGWNHIKLRHLEDFKELFGVNDNNEVLELFENIFKDPDEVKYGYNPISKKYEYRLYKQYGDGKYILMALDRQGSVTTAWPTTDPQKVNKFISFQIGGE